MKPRRRICDQTDTLPAASAAELVPKVLGFLFFGAYQQRREGDPDASVTQFLHIICPGLHPGEDTPASPHGVDTTREAADKTREHGVGFAIKNNLLGSIIPPSEGTK